MAAHLTDMARRSLGLWVSATDWARIVRLLHSLKALDESTLARMGSGEKNFNVPQEAARRIADLLDRKFTDDVQMAIEPPSIPDYIVPIAASNGVWIDPALPLLNPPEPATCYLRFAEFCRICSGFSIS